MKRFLPFLLLMLLLGGCADKAAQFSMVDHAATVDHSLDAASPDDEEFLDDSAFDEANPINEAPIADPLEPWNRMWFSFNDFFYMNIAKPIYTGYEAVVHEDIRSGLSNALNNLKAPVRIVNSLLQLEFAQATVEFGRFLFNSTFGGAGLMDLVPVEKALVPVNLASADFGGTLSKWGFGEGVYLVWPILGPSTLRDTVGFAGDTVASGPFWAAEPIGPVSPWITRPTAGALYFNSYGGMLKSYEALTKAAIEPYSSLRNAWVQTRRNALLPPSTTW